MLVVNLNVVVYCFATLKLFGSRVESEVTGFLCIFTYTDDGSFWVRLGYSRVKEKIGPYAGLELPARAIDSRKATLKYKDIRNFGLPIMFLILIFDAHII